MFRRLSLATAVLSLSTIGLFAQGGANGANLKAAQESWPVVLAALRKYLQ